MVGRSLSGRAVHYIFLILLPFFSRKVIFENLRQRLLSCIIVVLLPEALEGNKIKKDAVPITNANPFSKQKKVNTILLC
jgi:hypothetical protein